MMANEWAIKKNSNMLDGKERMSLMLETRLPNLCTHSEKVEYTKENC